eukprot:12906008-Prorocentrum_lima.AAC.1
MLPQSVPMECLVLVPMAYLVPASVLAAAVVLALDVLALGPGRSRCLFGLHLTSTCPLGMRSILVQSS